jgi:CMP-N,N'-diacetyllegionaminic acid synthase
VVILIPARGGSKRIPGKALKLLGGKPLIRWAVDSCEALMIQPDVRVVVASDSLDVLRAVSSDAGALLTWERPMWTASDEAPDITWLSLALDLWPDEDTFMVRRPTSPFLTRATIGRAWRDFRACPEATAMRAMRPVTEHPLKTWGRNGLWMGPFAEANYPHNIEACSCPTQVLPKAWVQTAGLEIIRRSTLESGSLTGDRLLPLFLEGPEALDINTPDDWARAEEIAKTWTPS